MKFSIKHNRSQQDAVQQIKQMLTQHKTEIEKNASDVEERWEGNKLFFGAKLQGQHITGSVAVAEHTYEIEVKLPLMLRLFEGKIERAIREQAGQLLA